jgi:hypothetical protein
MTGAEPAPAPLIEPSDEPTTEWWAYGGILVLYGGRMLAWLTDSGDGEELLFESRRRGGSFTVGLLYPVLVTRRDGRTHMHGSSGKAHGWVDATLAALLRAEHYAAQARLALLRMKPPPPLGRIRLDEAIDPVRAIAWGLTDRADRAALLAYVVAELSAALPAPSPHREATGDE